VFEAADIREWRGHGVVDAKGRKIGRLEAVCVDKSTDRAAFATVTSYLWALGAFDRVGLHSGP
jgi:hypothetical protein